MWLLILSTVLIAVAESFWKYGSDEITGIFSFLNMYVLIGFILYGISFFVLVHVLKSGELSSVYPVMSLSFVWAFLISLYFFNETFTISKIAGMTMIIGGVWIINGRSNTKGN